MLEEKERLKEEWREFEEQRKNFEMERRNFTEAAIRLGHEVLTCVQLLWTSEFSSLFILILPRCSLLSEEVFRGRSCNMAQTSVSEHNICRPDETTKSHDGRTFKV